MCRLVDFLTGCWNVQQKNPLHYGMSIYLKNYFCFFPDTMCMENSCPKELKTGAALKRNAVENEKQYIRRKVNKNYTNRQPQLKFKKSTHNTNRNGMPWHQAHDSKFTAINPTKRRQLKAKKKQQKQSSFKLYRVLLKSKGLNYQSLSLRLHSGIWRKTITFYYYLINLSIFNWIHRWLLSPKNKNMFVHFVLAWHWHVQEPTFK